MSEKIYILLPVHNRSAITEHFVNCLAAQTYRSYHLVLIDDGSTDGTADMVRAKIKEISVIKGDGNWWWAGSLQQGIDWLKKRRVSDREIVMFANDDITFGVDFLQKATNVMKGLHNALLLPYVLNEKTGQSEDPGLEVDFCTLSFHPASSPEKVNCLPTRGLFMRMADLRKVGNFHPRLLPHYLSDYEFTIRAHRNGLKLITSEDIIIRLDRDQTGFRSLDHIDFIEFVKKYFSKKYVSNPIYWSVFILMTLPKSYVLGRLLRLWAATVKILLVRCANDIKKI